MKTEAGDVPLLAVGGGAFLVPDQLAGVSEVDPCRARRLRQRRRRRHRPGVGRVRPDLPGYARADAIAAAQGIADERAVAAGADRKPLSTIETEDMPIAYLPGNSLRVRVRVVGDVAAN